MDVVATALRVAIRALPFAGRAVLDRRRRHLIADRSALAFPNREQTDALTAQLTPAQATRLERFFDSPQFAQLMHKAMVCAVVKQSEELRTCLRAELRESLRHTGAFSTENLFEATDTIEVLLHNSVHTIRGAAMAEQSLNETTVALAARMSVAAARNSELLRKTATLKRYDDGLDPFRRTGSMS